MIRILGARLEWLEDAEALLFSLPPQWREAWSEAHPKSRGDARRLSLGGLSLLRLLGGEGELIYQNGKPFLRDVGVDFSISHTGGAVFCAVSKDAEDGKIGLDAEDMGRSPELRPETLAKRWFSQAEREIFEKNNTREAFFGIWTRKEALVKQSGVGLSGLREADSVALVQEGERFFQTLHKDEFLISVCCGQKTQVVLSWLGEL